MTKSYRIRTAPGTDKNIRVNINQDFDFLEILSLKLRQEDVYTRFCADYGVVAGILYCLIRGIKPRKILAKIAKAPAASI